MFSKRNFYRGKTDNQKEKARARNTKAWSQLKEIVVKRYFGVDPVTKAPLRRGWNLHHCDMRKEFYNDFNPDKFLPLNNRTHEFIHWLYDYWRNDKGIMDRLKLVMEMMGRANGGAL